MGAEEIDGYLAGVEEPKRSTLEALRRSILAVVPDAEQCLSYNMPAFRVHGKVVAGFAAFKNHLAYLPHSGAVLGDLGDALAAYQRTAAGRPGPSPRRGQAGPPRARRLISPDRAQMPSRPYTGCIGNRRVRLIWSALPPGVSAVGARHEPKHSAPGERSRLRDQARRTTGGRRGGYVTGAAEYSGRGLVGHTASTPVGGPPVGSATPHTGAHERPCSGTGQRGHHPGARHGGA
jgi:hypothetical protein